MDQKHHPVWGLYDRLRDARLNVKYYERRLAFVERCATSCEIILLATAPSSAIASLWFWDTVAGSWFWKLIGVVAAIVAVVKPVLFPVKKLKDFEEVLTGYRLIWYDLDQIRYSVERLQKYDTTLQNDFEKVQQREKSLILKNPERCEVSRVKRKCDEEVRREYPVSSFFIPKE